MADQIEFQNYEQAAPLPESGQLRQSKLAKHVQARIDELGFPVSCIIQLDDTRDAIHDYTQIWLSRCGRNPWNKIYQLPVPYQDFESENPSPLTIKNVDVFFFAFKAEENKINVDDMRSRDF
jgi:hypothetical protein